MSFPHCTASAQRKYTVNDAAEKADFEQNCNCSHIAREECVHKVKFGEIALTLYLTMCHSAMLFRVMEQY